MRRQQRRIEALDLGIAKAPAFAVRVPRAVTKRPLALGRAGHKNNKNLTSVNDGKLILF